MKFIASYALTFFGYSITSVLTSVAPNLVKMEGNSNSVEWKEVAILKLLFPSTPFISEK